MHRIAFVPASTLGEAPALDPYPSAALSSLPEGDVVWLVTRMTDDRATPALCGRIVIGGRHDADPADARPGPAAAVDVDASERCDPFPCDPIHSWPIWRTPFEGPAELTDTQAACLETYWAGARGRRIKHPSA